MNISLLKSGIRIGSMLGLTLAVLMIPTTETVTRAEVSKAGAAEVSAQLFELAVKEVDSIIPGCINCVRGVERVPALDLRNDFSELSDALKIHTYSAPPNVYGYTVSAGGCGISSSKELYCWGSNSLGQLGNGTLLSSNSPVKAVQLSNVVDVAANGATTCALSNQQVFCTGLGPWPVSGNQGSVWTQISDEAVVSVSMSTVVSSGARPAICVTTLSRRLKCYSDSVNGSGNRVFAWIDSGLNDVSEADISNMYYPGFANICALSSGDIFCGSVSNYGGISLSRKISSSLKFSRIYLFASGYPVICGWANGLLSCAQFTYPAGSIYTAPAELRVLGIVAEPKSIVYAEIDTVRRIYVLTSSQILAAKSDSLTSTSYSYGSTSSVIEPVVVSKSVIQGTSIGLSMLPGTTNSVNFISGRFSKSLRSLLGSRVVKILVGQEPLVGAKVRWFTSDDPAVLQSSPSISFITDEKGSVRFPQLATGSISFTISGGKLSNGVSLQVSTLNMEVSANNDVVVNVPSPAQMKEKTFTVALPDGSPVPNAEIRLRNMFITYNYLTSEQGQAVWSAQPVDAKGYLASANCAFCLVPPPAYISDSAGVARIPMFIDSRTSSRFDASVSYDDGIISQSKNIDRLSDIDSIRFDYMQTIKVDVKKESIDVPNSGKVALPVSLIDELGKPIADAIVSVEDVCDEKMNGGIWQEGKSISSIGCRSSLVSKKTLGSVTAQAISCRRVGKTNFLGVVKFSLCPTSSTYVRIKSDGSLPSRTVCLVVKKKKCSVSSSSLMTLSTLRLSRTISGKTVATVAKLKVVSTSRFFLKVVPSSAKFCRVSGSSLKGLKAGSCKVTVTVKPKNGKAVSKTVTLKVTK